MRLRPAYRQRYQPPALLARKTKKCRWEEVLDRQPLAPTGRVGVVAPQPFDVARRVIRRNAWARWFSPEFTACAHTTQAEEFESTCHMREL